MKRNPEIMNAKGNFRYTTKAGVVNKIRDLCKGLEMQIGDALRPDGPVARRFLSKNLIFIAIGDSVFTHGGLLLLVNHVNYELETVHG